MNEHFNAGKLTSDLQKLINEAEALLRSTSEQNGERTAETRAQAEEALRSMRHRLAALEKEIRGQAKTVDHYVQDNPWAAVAVAGGAALLLGLILGRR